LDLLSRDGSESLVRITCGHCQDSRLIAVAVATEVLPVPVRDEPIDNLGLQITPDDVLDAKLALSSYLGDLRSWIERPQAPPSPR
jgi:hypothetical protein